MRAPLLSALLPSLVAVASASANDIHVGPSGSIQAAIDGASPGDRILVAPGTYVGTIDFHGRAVEVIGVQGAGATTLDGAFSGPVVRFQSGEGLQSVLRGFTVTHGSAPLGAGGIAASGGATPRIEDCIVRQNVGKFGGGVSGSPVLRRCVVTANTANVSHGGGLYGAPQLYHCVVAANTCSSGSGGGLYLQKGTSIIEDCLFLENRSILTGGKGGAIYVKSSATATVRRTVLAGNYTTAGNFNALGGAIAVEAAGTLVERCVLVSNSLNGNTELGGAIWGPATVVNSIVRDNSLPQLSGVSSVSWSDVQGGAPGVGNFDLVPRFVSSIDGDYHLDHGSTCIDAGDPSLLDPDGTRSDVGAFPFRTLYARSNSTAADWADPTWPEISVSVGGRHELRVLGDASDAGNAFLTLGSIGGTSPGTSILGVPLPLNPDAYFAFTLTHPNSPLLSGSFGVLDGTGHATVTFALPGDVTSPLAGTIVHHAAIAGTAAPSVSLVTGAEPLALVP